MKTSRHERTHHSGIEGAAASLLAGSDNVDAGAIVALRGISKSYPGVQALSNVDVDFYPGTVHAISGENGAGKSTLSKVIAGIVIPDEGRLHIENKVVHLTSPADALKLGVSAVPQELSLVPHMTVAENISVASFPNWVGLVSRRELRAQAQPILDSLGLNIDPFSLLGDHSPGVQQLVMIGRSFVHEAKVIILDEPTAALTEPEVNHLFEVVRKAQDAGTAFILVSHRFQDLSRIADTVTVLRDGVRILTAPMKDLGHDDIVKAMVGRTVERFEHDIHDPKDEVADGAAERISLGPGLSVKGLTSPGHFEDISFDVRPGEIVGLGGLLGAGRTEVARAIFGVDSFQSGHVEVNGKTRRIKTPKDAIRAGIIMVPEERKSQGLVLDMAIHENLTVSDPRAISKAGWLNNRRARKIGRDLIERLSIKANGPDVVVRTLSGGNQQKVVIGRCFLNDFPVYIFDEPTRGVDVNAKFQIYRLVSALAKRGAAVLVISSELPELLAIADRILVMREGRIVAELDASEATEERILSSAMV